MQVEEGRLQQLLATARNAFLGQPCAQEPVPQLSLSVQAALTGQHIADVQANPEDTILELSKAAILAAGLDVNLRLFHDGRSIANSETIAEAGFQEGQPVFAVVERRQRKINRMIEVYEQAERLNACFMVDCTGSMNSHISAVKDQIRGIVREMQMSLPNMQLRLSFLGYRDHGDLVRFELLPFTTSVEEFQAYVADVRATGGGGDGPEDVHGAVDLACTLDWTTGGAATRVLIHIADHPAHGRQWNDSPRDHYPDGDPYGLDLLNLMQKLRSLDVQYVFGHVTSHTHKMVRVLNEELCGYVDTKDMNDAAQVAATVTASLHASVATTVNTLSSKGAPRKLEPEELSSEIPDWSSVPGFSVRIKSCLPIEDVSQLHADAIPEATRRVSESSSTVQLATMPFSQGESRTARHALSDGSNAVAKHFKGCDCAGSDSEEEDEAAADAMEPFLALSEVSAVAAFLASLFSEDQPHGEKVSFLPSAVAYGDGIPPFNLESSLPASEFSRYSNNIGWWEPDAPRTLMRFSNWTSEVTGGHMMVVDLQGVKTHDGWLLTDPCVLCADTSRFGSGNLGGYAMSRCVNGLTRLLDGAASSADVSGAQPAVRAPPNAWKCNDSDVPPLDIDTVIENLLAAKPGKRVQIDQGQIQRLVSAARDVFLRQPPLLELHAPLKILGDIHGQYHDLLRYFEMGGHPPSENYLMLGDYVDRGKQSIETISLLLAYKIKYPENMFLLRGNHECASITRIYGFYDECKRKYNIKMWKQFCDAFNCLPPAALIDDQILCMHGGISPELSAFDQIRGMARPIDVPDTGLLCDLLWADPDKDVSGWCESDRGVSYIYGPDVLTQFNTRMGLDLIVRAHQIVQDGYEFFASKQLVTLFSAPKYCGEFDNAGAMLSVSDDLQCSFQVLAP